MFSQFLQMTTAVWRQAYRPLPVDAAVGTEGRHRVIEENFFSSVKQVLSCFRIFSNDNRGLTPGVPTAIGDAAVGTEGQHRVDVSGRHRQHPG